MKDLRIVLGDRTLRYLRGGGHWAVRVQYLLGLRDLGCDVTLLEVWPTSGNQADDAARFEQFLGQLAPYGLDHNAIVLTVDGDVDCQDPETANVFGCSRAALLQRIDEADILWNLAASIREPLLSRFSRKALLDVDPGIVQVSAQTVDMDLHSHDAFLTVGCKINDSDCEVPRLGIEWTPFFPFVYLDLWEVMPDVGPNAPVTTVTHWNWRELTYEGRILSMSKRSAYLEYVGLPSESGRPFTLATHIPERDRHDDRALLHRNGWQIVDPREMTQTIAAYAAFISRSRGEISCPKPVYRVLRTGWFSDRSACYLASGRPVIAEETGFSDHLPTGSGLMAFSDFAEALEAVREMDANYAYHMRSARAIAEELLDSRKRLPPMLEASL